MNKRVVLSPRAEAVLRELQSHANLVPTSTQPHSILYESRLALAAHFSPQAHYPVAWKSEPMAHRDRVLDNESMQGARPPTCCSLMPRRSARSLHAAPTTRQDASRAGRRTPAETCCMGHHREGDLVMDFCDPHRLRAATSRCLNVASHATGHPGSPALTPFSTPPPPR